MTIEIGIFSRKFCTQWILQSGC